METEFFTQDFETFTGGLNRTTLALYAGGALVLWVLFKDKMSPVQKLLEGLFAKGKSLLNKSETPPTDSTLPSLTDLVAKANPVKKDENRDVFLELIISWKQTRELAVLSKCDKAVEVADEMFPYLSPKVCSEKKDLV